ncbi:hypothetical protein E2C01_084428 [Portunus trituberculatus]|uniref:Uncharacterized protein n=1 Tax=Portunus trituberculatus TaxID=210409 RepID=A0A5B7J7G5_PORTR|nr:hypothetical protein [Portunus trituberculatus]
MAAIMVGRKAAPRRSPPRRSLGTPNSAAPLRLAWHLQTPLSTCIKRLISRQPAGGQETLSVPCEQTRHANTRLC